METIVDERKKSLPAWGLSLAVHTVLLIALSWLFAGGVVQREASEVSRSVGIVLAQPIATATPRYLTEADSSLNATESNESTADATGTPLAISAVETPTDFIPTDLALPNTSPLTLPGLTTQSTPRLSVTGRRPKLPGVDESAIIAAEQAGLRAREARGPQAQVGLFGSDVAVGNSFVFLIDRSKSMGGAGLGVINDARDELVRVLRGLDARHRFQVIVYHDKCVYLNKREMLSATDENKEAVPEFLGSKAAFGGTEHEQSLLSALRLEPDVIFLLTDGGDPPLADHQIRGLTKLAAGRTTIHCLHFGLGPQQQSDNFLSRLATATGGSYGYIDVSQRRVVP